MDRIALVVFEDGVDAVHFCEVSIADNSVEQLLRSFNNQFIGSESIEDATERDMLSFFYEWGGEKFKLKPLQLPIENQHYALIINCGCCA